MNQLANLCTITLAISVASCVSIPDDAETTDSDDIGTAQQALLSLPSAPTIYYPQIAGDSGHSVFVQWSKISDATQYRIQISQLNSFSSDSCATPFPCDVNTVVMASTVCGASLCSTTVNVPGTGARSLRVRGGKTGVGGYWSSIRKFAVWNW